MPAFQTFKVWRDLGDWLTRWPSSLDPLVTMDGIRPMTTAKFSLTPNLSRFECYQSSAISNESLLIGVTLPDKSDTVWHWLLGQVAQECSPWAKWASILGGVSTLMSSDLWRTTDWRARLWDGISTFQFLLCPTICLASFSTLQFGHTKYRLFSIFARGQNPILRVIDWLQSESTWKRRVKPNLWGRAKMASRTGEVFANIQTFNAKSTGHRSTKLTKA